MKRATSVRSASAWVAVVFCLHASATFTPATSAEGGSASRPKLVKLPFAIHKGMENTPFVYEGRPLIAMNYRDDTKYNTDGYANFYSDGYTRP